MRPEHDEASRAMNNAAGAVLRRWREKAGMSRASMASAMSISVQQLAKYESGQNGMSLSRLGSGSV